MNSNEIIYHLTVEDIQNVAAQELERELKDDEINNILDSIAEKINWYDAIANSITEKLQ